MGASLGGGNEGRREGRGEVWIDYEKVLRRVLKRGPLKTSGRIDLAGQEKKEESRRNKVMRKGGLRITKGENQKNTVISDGEGSGT